ncbi:MAG: Cell division protein FtsL, partial [Clostridiales bacterium]|nr:Cell division protein FtsL [Clostridiales bacterium]
MLETGKTPYVQGTAAEKIEYNVYEENKVLKAKKQQKSNNNEKVKIVVAVILTFACCLTLIFRYAQITEMNYKLLKANNQYNEIMNENSRL